MMDLIILVAVFVAILALAYFTYRNIVGLDIRLRKIEDVLKNAEVVAAPVHTPTQEQSENHHPVENISEENTRIPGWGGEGPPINVERVPLTSDEEERDVQVMDLHESEGEDDLSGLDDDDSGDDDDGEDGEDGEDGVGDNEENTREKSKYSSLRVSELRDVLKKANVPFPNGAKKALLVSLIESNNVELSA